MLAEIAGQVFILGYGVSVVRRTSSEHVQSFSDRSRSTPVIRYRRERYSRSGATISFTSDFLEDYGARDTESWIV